MVQSFSFRGIASTANRLEAHTMRFEELRIKKIDLKDPAAAYKLLAEDLCGETYYAKISPTTESQISKVLKMADSDGLNYEQFNELLLLLDQDRVSRAFFAHFFDDFIKDLEHLVNCIVKFRGFGMLCYGNFRFAYKNLSRASESELKHSMEPFCRSTSELTKAFHERPSPALKIEKIKREDTWCSGYIAKRRYEKEISLLSEEISQSPTNAELLKQGQFYSELSQKIKNVEATALNNTDVYLTWDYMDVYIATSMRNQWEFEDTAEVVEELFRAPRVRTLNIRYFDPTQSLCKYRIDKGLVEALMLKRARCTVYMVQESDTMGKDSELASTLAQGKPVIAYVPKIEVSKHAEKLRVYPLEFFKIRFQVLQVEGIFDDPKCREELGKLEPDFPGLINGFMVDLSKYRSNQPFTLWKTREEEFKSQQKTFHSLCKILATAEKHNFEKRAGVLKTVHPLGLQVHLESGVANGVLVVRTIAECADVLVRLLTNNLKFNITVDEKEGCTILEESITECAFRAVTLYEKLSNSFWNFYLSTESRGAECRNRPK
jgi:hypothetical protein